MGQILQTINVKVKSSSNNFLIFLLRLASGAMLGLTLALIGQEIFEYQVFSFVFVIVITTGLFLRRSRRWGAARVFVFDLICVLVALLLRVYILVAPGA